MNQTLSSMSAGEKEKMLLHNKEVERFDIHAQDTTVCLCCSGDAGMTETTKKKCVILYRMCYFTKHSAVLAKLIMQELKVSHIFRQNFVRYAFSHWERMKCQYIEWKTDCTVPSVLIIGLEWPNQNILDYKWLVIIGMYFYYSYIIFSSSIPECVCVRIIIVYKICLASYIICQKIILRHLTR